MWCIWSVTRLQGFLISYLAARTQNFCTLWDKLQRRKMRHFSLVWVIHCFHLRCAGKRVVVWMLAACTGNWLAKVTSWIQETQLLARSFWSILWIILLPRGTRDWPVSMTIAWLISQPVPLGILATICSLMFQLLICLCFLLEDWLAEFFTLPTSFFLFCLDNDGKHHTWSKYSQLDVQCSCWSTKGYYRECSFSYSFLVDCLFLIPVYGHKGRGPTIFSGWLCFRTRGLLFEDRGAVHQQSMASTKQS